jgi:hypothetical protein
MTAFTLLLILLLSGCIEESPPPPEPEKAADIGTVPENTALLISGPEEKKGIPFIGPNAAAYFSGVYLMGEEKITVLYTPEGFVFSDEWSRAPCSPRDIPVFSIKQSVLLTSVGGGRYLIFIYPENREKPPGEDCRFVQFFYPRFQYFQNSLGSEIDAHFPAVIRIQ